MKTTIQKRNTCRTCKNFEHPDSPKPDDWGHCRKEGKPTSGVWPECEHYVHDPCPSKSPENAPESTQTTRRVPKVHPTLEIPSQGTSGILDALTRGILLAMLESAHSIHVEVIGKRVRFKVTEV